MISVDCEDSIATHLRGGDFLCGKFSDLVISCASHSRIDHFWYLNKVNNELMVGPAVEEFLPLTNGVRSWRCDSDIGVNNSYISGFFLLTRNRVRSQDEWRGRHRESRGRDRLRMNCEAFENWTV